MDQNKHIETWNIVNESVISYYKGLKRYVARIGPSREEKDGGASLAYLVDRIHVIRYYFGLDRGLLVGAVAIGIGPEYVGAADFWSYEDSERFAMEVTPDAIRHNLELLDEFWDSHPAVGR